MVDEALKGLGCVAEFEGHSQKLKQSKGRDDSGLQDIVRFYGDLMVRSDEVKLRKNVGTMQGCGKLLNVWNRVVVGDGCVVEGAIVAARRQFFLGTMCSGEDQLLEEGRTIPNSIMCSNSLRAMERRSGARRRVRACPDWGSSGHDVVSDIVFDWTLGGTGSNDSGELVENDLKLALRCPRQETGLGDCEKGNALYLQGVCESVGELVASHINKEGEMAEEVGTKDWMLNISDDEDPVEGASESKIEGEGSSAVSHYRCVIDYSQAGAILSMCAFGTGRRDDAHFGTGIDQKAEPRGSVGNVKYPTW